ncbi:zinc-regulated TonB-dependent outer membrane receptor [Vulgatibacter sp.]|uniref:zinc-regulated TonB-dependent outer membrane receptor n=1 Tax=Vulgatibacter sp. TaxID=1971226 RepID=UPI0035632968
MSNFVPAAGSRSVVAACIVAELLLLAPTAHAQEKTPDETAEEAAERARLEAELASELAAPAPAAAAQTSGGLSPGKLLPDISAIGTFVGSYFSDTPALRLPAHEPSHTGFELQEIELGFRSAIDPYFRADVFLSLSLFGIEVEEAYATTLALPWNLQLRGGAFYSPFGRFNQVHFLELTPFVDMPLPNRRFFGGEQLRGLGVEASVLLPLPFFLELRASVQDAGNELSFGVPSEEIEDLADLLYVGRALSSFDLAERITLNLGLSAANGPNAAGGFLVTDENRTDVFGADLYLRFRDRSSVAYTALQSEYLYRRATVPDGRLEQGGLYAWVVRRFDRHWEAAIRYDLLGLPDGTAIDEPVVQSEELGEFLAPATQERVGASLTYYPSEFSRLRLQANHDFGLVTPDGDSGPVTELFLQFQFVMGAHGAHAF